MWEMFHHHIHHSKYIYIYISTVTLLLSSSHPFPPHIAWAARPPCLLKPRREGTSTTLKNDGDAGKTRIDPYQSPTRQQKHANDDEFVEDLLCVGLDNPCQYWWPQPSSLERSLVFLRHTFEIYTPRRVTTDCCWEGGQFKHRFSWNNTLNKCWTETSCLNPSGNV